MKWTAIAMCCVATAWAAPVAAQEDPPEPAPAPAPAPHTSADVAGAPSADQAHNRVVEPSRDGEWALWIPRVLLFPVRAVGEVVVFPIRWGLYGYETLNLGPRVKGIFFNEDGTVGLFPTALIETGFGLNVGGRLILRRIVGDTGLTSRAGFGGRFEQVYSTKIATKDTFKHVEIELEGLYEVRPKDIFFGIGNGDLSDEQPAMPLDPRGDIQRESRFRQDIFRVTAAVSYRLTSQLRLTGSGSLSDRSFDDAEEEDDEQIATNFDTSRLTGFDDGSRTAYGELELTYDSRRAPTHWEGPSMPSTGWLAQVYAGYMLGLSDDPARYVRYGGDLQRYLRIGEAPRTLALRLNLEAVTGSYDEVSFSDLPRLGGPLLLRGYEQDRLRDRVAGLGSAEYQFDAIEFLAGFLFVDAGRVASHIDEFDSAEVRVGFGGGLQAHTRGSFLGRLTLATSIDGGFFATLSLDPVYDVRARVERK